MSAFQVVAAQNQQNAEVTSFNVPKVGSPQAGDYWLTYWVKDDDPAIGGADAAIWHDPGVVLNATAIASRDSRHLLMIGPAAAGDPDPLDGLTQDSETSRGCIALLRGIDPANVLDAAAVSSEYVNTAANRGDVPDITAAAGGVHVVFYGGNDSTSGTTTPPAGYTEIGTDQTATGISIPHFLIAYKDDVPAGLISGVSFQTPRGGDGRRGSFVLGALAGGAAGGVRDLSLLDVG